jgi:hypothetical protein
MVEYGYNEDELGETKPKTYGDEEPGLGDLLTAKPDEAAKEAFKLWKSQDQIMAPKLAQWKANRLRRRGVPNVQVVKMQDSQTFKVWTPPNASPDSVPAVNKTAQLCRKMTGQMFADPPKAECIPSTGEDQDVEAAEFATRVLEDIDSEANLNEPATGRRAFDRSHTYGSAFVFYYIDPRGGGMQPVEVQAGDGAQHIDEAVERQVPRMQPIVDELGQQVGEEPEVDEMGQPATDTMPWDSYVQKFVMPDGTLSDDKGMAAKQWVPALRREVVKAPCVRFMPHTAEDLWDAHGVQIGTMASTWGELKTRFPELAKLPDEKVEEILRFRPEKVEELMPTGEKRESKTDNKDEQLVFVLTTIYTQCDKYPKGAYVISVADKLAVHQQEWTHQHESGEEESLLIPLTQYMQFDEGRDDPYKVGLVEIVGIAGDIRAAVFGAFIDHLEKFGNRKVFIPTNSIINPADLQLPTKTAIPINPGGKPEYEDIPNFPADGMNMWTITSQEMDTASGLEGTAQGLEDSNVKSGRHAMQIISQVHAGLSEIKQNVERAFVRGARIKLQLVRAFYDQPRRIKWTGEDGRYKEKARTGADLGSTKDVKIKTGTMSMMTPMQKAQLTEHYAQFGVLNQEELRESLTSNLGGTLALQDNPFRQRIKQQISDISDGPDEGWQPVPPQAQPVIDPMTGAPAIDPVTGQPQVQMVPGMDPVLMEIWQPTPADMLPNVAQIRLTELARFTQSAKYKKLVPEWKQSVDAEFMRMMQIVQQSMAAQLQSERPPKEKEQSENPEARADREADKVAQKQATAA